MKLIANVLRILFCFMPVFSAYAQKAETPQISDMKVGDSWEWAVLDPYSKAEQSRTILTIMNIDGVLKRTTVGSDHKFAVPLDKIISGEQKSVWGPWHVWPLEVGSKWRHEHEWTRTDGYVGINKQDAEVVAYEDITVPAGKFKAYKIEYHGYQTIYAGPTGGQGKLDVTYWYVPELLTDVKIMSSFRGKPGTLRELVGYKRVTP